MDKELYWLWLTLKIKQSSKVKGLIEYFNNAENIYNSKENELAKVCGSKAAAALADKSLEEAKTVYDSALGMGAYIITYDSDSYPPLLRNIYDPPYVLYARGNLYDWNSFIGIGVVGTRHCDKDGIGATEFIASELAKNNIMVISGMAAGIDSVAARAALGVNKPTIAVLGSGIDRPYPESNKELFDIIEERGLILSEYPPGFAAARWTFPQRNRIISGLSRGVLVIQAPEKSGALITVRQAYENGRDVFAVPGNILNRNFAGSNKLISDGAVPVLCAEDIMREYPECICMEPRVVRHCGNERTEKSKDDKERTIEYVRPDEEKLGDISHGQIICNCILNGITHVDEISRELGIPMNILNGELLMLEVEGILEALPGNKYKLKLSK